jgi:hypothetical protein
MNHYFVAADNHVEFIEQLDNDQECVIRFDLVQAKTLKAYLETAIEDAEHHNRMAKEELLASLRQKVQELEEHLAG